MKSREDISNCKCEGFLEKIVKATDVDSSILVFAVGLIETIANVPDVLQEQNSLLLIAIFQRDDFTNASICTAFFKSLTCLCYKEYGYLYLDALFKDDQESMF